MRIVVIGGTEFIGLRLVEKLVERGDEVLVVHRGRTEPDDATGFTHLYVDRREFATMAGRVAAFRPDAVVDTCADSAPDVQSVLPYLPDVHLVVLSSATYSVRAGIELIMAEAGVDAELVAVPDDALPADLRPTRVRSQHPVVSSRKAMTLLDWQPQDPATSIARSVRWHLDNPPADPATDFNADDRALARRDGLDLGHSAAP